MPQIIDVPGQGQVEFPDGMTDEQIVAVIKKNTGLAAGKMALEGTSGTEKFLIGAGKGMTDVVRGVGQLVGLGDQQAIDESKLRDSAIGQTGAGLAGEIAGNVAMTAIPGAGAQGLLARGTAAVLPRLIAPTAAAAGAGSVLGATTQPVATGDSRLQNAGMGAAGGAAGHLLGQAASRLAQPIMQSQAVRTLLDNGIVPTPGQAAGNRTLAGNIEQKAESLPLVGQIIQNAKQRAVGELNLAQLRRSVPAADANQITQIGRAGIEQVDQVLHQGYGDALSRIPQVVPGPQFTQTLNTVLHDPDIALTPAAQAQLVNMVRGQFQGRSGVGPNGEVSGEIAKRIDSTFGMLARRYSASQEPDNRALGLALRAVQGEWRDTIRAAASDAATATRLDDLNRAYANFVRSERAASYVGAREGVFSPSNLQTAVKAADSSTRKRAFAGGRSLGQDLSDPAKAVLTDTVGDSGTAGRYLLNTLLLGGTTGGVAANEHFGGPGYLSALALAPLMYSRPGARYMVGDLIPGQQGLATLMRQASPYATQAGVAAAEYRNK